jgi:hypothetical protein
MQQGPKLVQLLTEAMGRMASHTLSPVLAVTSFKLPFPVTHLLTWNLKFLNWFKYLELLLKLLFEKNSWSCGKKMATKSQNIWSNVSFFGKFSWINSEISFCFVGVDVGAGSPYLMQVYSGPAEVLTFPPAHFAAQNRLQLIFFPFSYFDFLIFFQLADW